MRINAEKCVKCDRCIPYCPMEAIVHRKTVFIKQNQCVECGACLRSGVCRVGAIEQPVLTWPRVIRSVFSNPLSLHTKLDLPGRGTEEMKTNDLTHRFRPGEIGMGVELGRPGLGATFGDIEKVAQALAKENVEFEDRNPVTFLIDRNTGDLKDTKIRREKVLTAIIELRVKHGSLAKVIQALRDISREINTVMSVGLITTCIDTQIPVLSTLEQAKISPRINGKTCLGLASDRSHKQVVHR